MHQWVQVPHRRRCLTQVHAARWASQSSAACTAFAARTCAVGAVEVEVDHRQGALPLVGASRPALPVACSRQAQGEARGGPSDACTVMCSRPTEVASLPTYTACTSASWEPTHPPTNPPGHPPTHPPTLALQRLPPRPDPLLLALVAALQGAGGAGAAGNVWLFVLVGKCTLPSTVLLLPLAAALYNVAPHKQPPLPAALPAACLVKLLQVLPSAAQDALLLLSLSPAAAAAAAGRCNAMQAGQISRPRPTPGCRSCTAAVAFRSYAGTQAPPLHPPSLHSLRLLPQPLLQALLGGGDARVVPPGGVGLQHAAGQGLHISRGDVLQRAGGGGGHMHITVCCDWVPDWEAAGSRASRPGVETREGGQHWWQRQVWGTHPPTSPPAARKSSEMAPPAAAAATAAAPVPFSVASAGAAAAAAAAAGGASKENSSSAAGACCWAAAGGCGGRQAGGQGR